jgi:N6-adenosine-specific RNA methylase IME4
MPHLPAIDADSPTTAAGQVLASGHCSASLFRCIVVDPPWDIQRGPMGKKNANGEWAGKSQSLGYPTMSVEEIAAMKLPAADDAHLYIWTVNKYVEATYGIARAWGFEPSTLLTWAKNPKKWNIGGAYANTTEFCLFARRGKLTAQERVMTTWWNWPRGKHSAKPEAFLDIVERVSPGPRLEIFARRNRLGWSTWGNECLNHVDLHSPQNSVLGSMETTKSGKK